MDALKYLNSFGDGNPDRPAWVWKVIHKVQLLIQEGITLNKLEELQIEAILTNKEQAAINIEVTAATLIAFIRSCKK